MKPILGGSARLVLVLFLIAGYQCLHAATISWKSPVDGNWTNAANWVPAQVPAAADTVVIAVPGSYRVQVAGTVTVANLTLGGAGASPVLAVASGAVTFTTLGEIANGAVLEASGGSLAGNLTVAAGGRLDLAGAAGKVFGDLGLLNQGTVRWLAGSVEFTTAGANARLTNAGVWEIHSSSALRHPYGGNQPVFVNLGTLRKVAGAGAASINNLVVQSSGTLQVDAGRLDFENCRGTFSGMISVAGGATFGFANSTFTNLVPAAVTGPGTATFNTGTLWLGGSLQPAGLRLASGTLRLLPSFQGGSITNLALHGMDLAGSNRVTGALLLNSSGVSGDLIVDPAGRLDFEGSGATTFGNLRLLNSGTVRWLAGALDFTSAGGSSRLTNAGLWEIHADASLRYPYGGEQPQFVNQGTLRKLNGDGTTAIVNLGFVQAGSIDIQKGRLDLQSCWGSIAGTTALGANSSLTFSTSTFTNLGPAAFTGAGVAAFNSGTLSLGGADQPAGLQLAGGTLRLLPAFQGGTITNLSLNGMNLSGSYRITGALVLSNSGISGDFVIDPAGRVDLTGASAKTFGNTRLLNSGTVRWLAGALDFTTAGGASRLTNAGVWEIHVDSSFRYPYGGEVPQFVNQGVLRKLAGTGTTLLGNIGVVQEGWIDIQKGRLDFQSCPGLLAGAASVAAGGSITFSSSSITNLADASFSGAGTATFGSGTLWLGGAAQPAGLALTGGTLRLLPAFQGGAITNLTLQGIELAGSNRLAGSLVLSNSSLSGDLVIGATGRLDLTGAGPKTFGETRLFNAGVVRWLAGSLDFTVAGGASQLTNAALWEIHSDSTFRHPYGGNRPEFVNSGTVRKLNGTGTTTLANLVFVNLGSVEIQKGRLDLQSSAGVMAGSAYVAQDAALTYSTSTLTNEVSAVFTGPGLASYNSGTLWLGGASQPPGLILSGGTVRLLPSFQSGTITNLILHGMELAGTNQLTGILVLSNSAIAGALTVQPAGRLDLTGNGTKVIGDVRLLNLGTVRWLGGLVDFPSLGDRIQITNAGLWEIHPDTTFRYAYGGSRPRFVNSGTLRKVAGSGTTTLSNFTLENPGIIEAGIGTLALPESFTNASGILRLTGGSLGGNNANAPIVVTGGIIEGSGGVRFATLLGGVISPGGSGIGDLQFSPSFSLSPPVTVRIQVTGATPGGQHDRIRVTGPVSLGNAALEIVTATGISVGEGVVLIENDGNDAVQGTFAGRAEGSLFDVSNRLYRLRYKSGTGNDTVLFRDDGSVVLFPRRPALGGLYRVAGLGTNFVTYAIQASTNLVDWVPIGTAPANGGGEFELDDPDTGLFPHRFYRAIGP